MATGEEEKKNKEKHVVIGEQLMKDLGLRYYNGNLYTYTNGFYSLIEDKMLKGHILRKIDINAKTSLCNESLSFVKNWLINNDDIEIDIAYINFRNGLYDLNNQCFIPHSPKIFTVNQVHVDYLEEIGENPLVDNYLDDLMCHNYERKEALLQVSGYSLTSQTIMQQGVVFYGPTAANR